MNEVTLRKIDESNFLDAFHLTLAPGQEAFVSHPIRSLAQAYVYYRQCTPFGIYHGDTMVGYVMVIYDYDLDTVTVDDTILTEPYLNSEEGDTMLPRDDRSVVRYTVPEGCVFVMGDNRNHSADSRSDKYGMIDTSKIVGRVVLPVLP